MRIVARLMPSALFLRYLEQQEAKIAVKEAEQHLRKAELQRQLAVDAIWEAGREHERLFAAQGAS